MFDFIVIDKGPVVPGKPWAILHTLSNMIAPADPHCCWANWANGKVPLAYFATQGAADQWIKSLPSNNAPAAPCSPAAEAPVLNTAQGAGSTPARGTT